MTMGTIWIQYSSPTNCVFHILQEVGVERNQSIWITHAHLNKIVNIARANHVAGLMRALRHVSVIWVVDFLLMFSNFFRLDLHNITRVASTKLWWNILQKSDFKSDLPWFSYGARKCTFIDFLTRDTRLVLPIVFAIAFTIVINVWRCLLTHLPLWCLISILIEPHTSQI